MNLCSLQAKEPLQVSLCELSDRMDHVGLPTWLLSRRLLAPIMRLYLCESCQIAASGTN